jgi:Fe-S-cluster containining protein
LVSLFLSFVKWYAKGLRFECTQCGNCCTGDAGFVWVTEEEIAAMAELLGMAVEEFEWDCVRPVRKSKSLREFPNGDCILFDSKTRYCTVYSARPRQCRTWPFWDDNVENPKSWAETCEVCPGSNHGRLYTLEEIETMSRNPLDEGTE